MKEIILGIDPGTRITGYGLIEVRGHQITPLDFGCIRPPVKAPTSKRYLIIFEAIEALIHTHNPTIVVVESQFVDKNPRSALKLGMATAMAMLAAEKNALPIFEYTPKKAKLAVAGNGNASKEQVQKMIQLHLSLSSLPEPCDAADALALALCHSHTLKWK